MADALLRRAPQLVARAPRRGEDGQSLSTRGLFPAGGILSAGMDGIRAAEWMATAMIASGFAPAN